MAHRAREMGTDHPLGRIACGICAAYAVVSGALLLLGQVAR
jgi:hypothetical protein